MTESINKKNENIEKKDVGKRISPFVYIPPGAKLNTKNCDLEPPKTKYENRKVIFERDAVKKVTRRNPDVSE